MTPPNSVPTPRDRESVRARAQAIRQTRLSRARSIRRRVVAGAAALFAAAWLMITVALASGNDPALASKTAAGSTSTQAVTSSATPSVVSSTSGAGSQTTSTAAKTTTAAADSTSTAAKSTAASSSGSGTSSVTTKQS